MRRATPLAILRDTVEAARRLWRRACRPECRNTRRGLRPEPLRVRFRLIAVTLVLACQAAGVARAQSLTATIPVNDYPAAVAINPVTNKIYVANYDNGFLTAIDGATNAATQIWVGWNPKGIAVNPVTNRIYVAVSFGDSIVEVDGSNNSTWGVYDGLGPRRIAVNPVTNKVYVVNETGSSFTVLDASARTTVQTYIPGRPIAIAVNPVTNRIYLANRDNATVTVVDGADNTLETIALAQDSRPEAIAVNPVTNRIYVGNTNFNNITVIDGLSKSMVATVPDVPNPVQIVVNPVTNRIYALTNDGVMEIEGASNDATPIAVAPSPSSLSINSVTNRIYVTSASTNYLTVIDGSDRSTASVAVGSAQQAVAVNPVTNRIYTSNPGTGGAPDNGVVAVIDGDRNARSTVFAGSQPGAVAVNPLTGMTYVANYLSNNVTAINNADNTFAMIPVGVNPVAIAVNPATNRIYVGNQGSANVTMIDGATSATTVFPSGFVPHAIAVDPVNDKIYVANRNNHNVTVITGADNSTTTVPAGTNPTALAVNLSTNRVYIANHGSHDVTVLDGADNSTMATVPAGTNPSAIAVNPVSNRIYVANALGGSVTVINGYGNSVDTTVPVGTAPIDVAVNLVTNRIYVANSGSSDVTVIDGVSNNPTTVPTGSSAKAIAVNPVANRIYLANSGATVIDGISNATTTSLINIDADAIAVNPVTGKVHLANGSANTVTVIEPAPSTLSNHGVSVLMPGGPITSQSSATLAVTVCCGFTPHDPPVRTVYYRRGDAQGPYTTATGSGPFSVTIPGLQPGLNYVSLYAVDAMEGTSINVPDPFGGTTSIVGPPKVFAVARVAQHETAYTFSTLAGKAGSVGKLDGAGTDARFHFPFSVGVDSNQNAYVADAFNHAIRRIDPDGVVTTLAGQPGSVGSADGAGYVAGFNNPQGVAVDLSGNVYVADTFNYTIRRITPGGFVITVAGLAGNPGSADGFGSNARFSQAASLAVDQDFNIYVADTFNHTIRKITPAGDVSTLAGSAGQPGSADGAGAAARFDHPNGVSADAAGNVYVSDSGNCTIRTITPGGAVTTLAGFAGTCGDADGAGTGARFKFPRAIAVDAAGNAFVADGDNHTIRQVTPDGAVTTLGGLAGATGSADGAGQIARFNSPFGMAVDAYGTLFVADTFNHTLRIGTAIGNSNKLEFGAINGGGNPLALAPFAVVVRSRTASGMPANATVDTTVSLSLAAGTGTLGGTPGCVIAAGSNACTVPSVTYSKSEGGVQLQAAATSGNALAGATSSVIFVGTEPEQTVPVRQDQPPDASVAPTPAHRAVVLTHGWKATGLDWPGTVASNLCADGIIGTRVNIANPSITVDVLAKMCKVMAANDVLWDIWVLDWRTKADTISPTHAYSNAKEIGDYLAASLQGMGYEHIHLIAHSAGSNVIDTATPALRSAGAAIHATFLDAFDPWALLSPTADGRHVSNYGAAANWVDNYVDTRPLALNYAGFGFLNADPTDLHLTFGLNIDVTPLADGCSGNASLIAKDQCRHARPYRFYGVSVNGSFIDDLQDPVGITGGMGFPIALEAGGNVNGLAAVKNQECRMQGNGDCLPVSSPFAGVWDYIKGAATDAAVGATGGAAGFVTGAGATLLSSLSLGTGVFAPDGNIQARPTAKATSAVEPPSWIVVWVTTTEPVDTLRFNRRFAAAGEGFLSVYVDGFLVREIDQRHVAATTWTLEEIFVGGQSGALPPGLHRIVFRLDGFGAAASGIQLTGVELGRTRLLTPTLDVDASVAATKYDALTDGLLVLRYLFGLTGTALTNNALGGTATMTDPAAIRTVLDRIRPALDVDGNGNADALTDGLMILRYLFGLRGAVLVSGAIGAGATRTTAEAIEAYLQGLVP